MVVPVNNTNTIPAFLLPPSDQSIGAVPPPFSLDQVIPPQPDIATDNNTANQQAQAILQEALIATTLENELFAEQLNNTSGSTGTDVVPNLPPVNVTTAATTSISSLIATSGNLTPAQIENQLQQLITQLYQQISSLQLFGISTTPAEQLAVFGQAGGSLLPGVENYNYYSSDIAPDGEIAEVESSFITDNPPAPAGATTASSTGSTGTTAANDNGAAQYSAANNNQIAAASPKNWVVA